MTTRPQGPGAPAPTTGRRKAEPIKISNAQFLAAIFPQLGPDESLWVCTFTDPPSSTTNWSGYAVSATSQAPSRPRSNTYFCVSSLRPDHEQQVRRRLDNFSRLHVVVLDDTQPPANLLPTWVLETSRPNGRSNTQVGYRLAEPLTAAPLARRLHRALAAGGHIGADVSGNNPVRYVRLPEGSNTKYRPAHPHRLLAWHPDRTVTLAELTAALGLDLDATTTTRAAPSPYQGERSGTTFYSAVNAAALGNLPAWVPALLPAARPYHEGYRVSSAALRRNLEEDLSILPEGIRDFGTEQAKTAIDVVLDWGAATDAAAAALWLCDRLALDPAALGWHGRRPAPSPAKRGPGGGDHPETAKESPSSHAYKLDEKGSVLSNQDVSLSEPSRNPLVTLSPGALLVTDPESGKKSRRIDSSAAEIVAKALQGRLAWDAEAASWLAWEGTHWQPQTTTATADKLLADAVHIGTDPMGFRLAYLTGISSIITRRGLLPTPVWPAHVTPFRNGLLDTQTLELRDAKPNYALDWCLPHDWDPQAECPNIKDWLNTAVENDEPTVEFLRAWLAALVRGIPLQVFLVLLGRGGSGKGTFQRLAMAIVGAANATVTTLRDLEENRFETAKLYGKRLAMVNEAGHHGGSLNMLKAVTGGDHLPLERKHVQQSGTFQFHGLVLMSTNEALTTSDNTSGIERRRITVRFPRSATPAERADWEARGGEQGVLHAEIPGLIRWVLAMPVEKIRDRIANPPNRITADNLLGMAAGNSVADWLMERTVPGPATGIEDEVMSVQIGMKDATNASYWAFANYIHYCEATGRRPVSLVRFGAIVCDMAESLGHHVYRAQHKTKRTWHLFGLRLRGELEDPPDWIASVREASRGCREGVEPPSRGQVIDSIEPREREAKLYSEFFGEGADDIPF